MNIQATRPITALCLGQALRVGALLCGMLWLCSAKAQTPISDDFTNATSATNWYFSGGACLTAGTSTTVPTPPSTIPACRAIFYSYY